MAALSPTTLEDHAAGGLVNAIINGNWDKLNETFDPATALGNDRFKLMAMGLLKLDDAALSALAEGKVLVWNNADQKVEARDQLSLDRLQLTSHTKLELVGNGLADPDTIDPTMPAADHPRTAVYCADGDGGSPCLAVSNGADWKIIALGAALAP